MTDQHHPITPPPSLVQQWIAEIWHEGTPVQVAQSDLHLATRAAAWGYEQRGEVNEAKLQKARDHQLEATLAEVSFLISRAQLLLRRLDPDSRPKPSLAEQGLAALRSTTCTEQCHYDALFAALTRLKQLEDSND